MLSVLNKKMLYAKTKVPWWNKLCKTGITPCATLFESCIILEMISPYFLFVKKEYTPPITYIIYIHINLF